MKKVIRYGVFETNSSSTHSLSLVKKGDKPDEYKRPVCFQVKSRVAKVALILGLIDNAEEQFQNKWKYIDDVSDIDSIKIDIAKKLKEIDSVSYYLICQDYPNFEEIPLQDMIVLIDKYCEWIYVSDIIEVIKNYEVYHVVYAYVHFRKDIQEFRNVLIKAFCELENVGEQEGWDKLCYEEYKHLVLDNILNNSPNKEAELTKYMNSSNNNIAPNYKSGFKNSEDTDIVEYTKKYLKDYVDMMKEKTECKFSCTRYFSYGCLDTCWCGFEDYGRLYSGLNLGINTFSIEKMTEYAKELLSDEYKFDGSEKLCGFDYAESDKEF